MRIVTFINQLGYGGSEKAACMWARELARRGHDICIVSLEDGPRRHELEAIPVTIVSRDANTLSQQLQELQPSVIHAHAPGHPHAGDVLGEALAGLPKKIPVVQTNIFGQSLNPREDAWTDFRLFISWTSCVQAARRSFRKLDESFFRRASVAIYPVLPAEDLNPPEVGNFRLKHGVSSDEILFGRLSRPEPNKWTDLPIQAFRLALRHNPQLKLLLREPPRSVARRLLAARDCERFIILPATVDNCELALTTSALDVVLHTSCVGESFGYGIAEPMNYGKPVIANSVPWLDQAQIELVRHGEWGFIASTPKTVAKAMVELSRDTNLRRKLGQRAKAHIRELANLPASADRLEKTLEAAIANADNPFAKEDAEHARAAARYLDARQFGHSWQEQFVLRPRYYWSRLHEWRHIIMASAQWRCI